MFKSDREPPSELSARPLRIASENGKSRGKPHADDDVGHVINLDSLKQLSRFSKIGLILQPRP